MLTLHCGETAKVKFAYFSKTHSEASRRLNSWNYVILVSLLRRRFTILSVLVIDFRKLMCKTLGWSS
jgi:hypothetical protein